MTRIAFLHTGAVVIGPVIEQARAALPDATFVNYLDDRIVADLGDPDRAASVPARVRDLTRAARSAGAEVVMLTCSSISHLAAPTAKAEGIEVMRIDEAMADAAIRLGGRISVLATLPTTLRPTVALLRERAGLAERTPIITEEIVEGAFAAVAAGDRTRHDALVAAAIRRPSGDADVIVLAQASMASAAESLDGDVPVLTSIASGIDRLRARVADEDERGADR